MIFSLYWIKLREQWNAPSESIIAERLFLKWLAAIYAIAFASLGLQILGLFGSDGILPIAHFLDVVHHRVGFERFFLLPTIFWFSATDRCLQGICALGFGLSLLTLCTKPRAFILFLLWFLYLSCLNVGGDFLSFQWDILLVEMGFLAIFFTRPSKPILWLLRFLLFRLMLSSGLAKLLSGDPTWRHLTALTFHYETQPLPTWIGWYAHQLPIWFHVLSTLFMFCIELIVPWFMFFSAPLRRAAALLLIGLQMLIFITGNYCFFNWLTVGLCLLLFDDNSWPKSWRGKKPLLPPPWPQWLMVPLVSFLLLLTFIETSASRRFSGIHWPKPIQTAYHLFDGFHLVNTYGLFAVMTTTRPEIIIEGSNDQQTWKAYEFQWKPGDLKRSPAFVAPHQPRLDWQMWFAAFSNYQHHPWFAHLMVRLLHGSPSVLSLLAYNPFPEKPPAFIRATRYLYHFTNMQSKKESGAWWSRELIDEYFPPLSLPE